jgi:hypothetical protein
MTAAADSLCNDMGRREQGSVGGVGRNGCEKVVYEGTGFELRHPLTGKTRPMAAEPQQGVEENFN